MWYVRSLDPVIALKLLQFSNNPVSIKINKSKDNEFLIMLEFKCPARLYINNKKNTVANTVIFYRALNQRSYLRNINEKTIIEFDIPQTPSTYSIAQGSSCRRI